MNGSNRDLAVAAVLALTVHGGIYGFPVGRLFSGPELMVARGVSAIEVRFASPEEPVDIPEVERPPLDEIPPPEEPEPERPVISPEDIVIPRAEKDELPPPERPEPERPVPEEAAAAGADVERGVRRARLIGQSKPTYPEYCRTHAIEGKVVVVVEVLASGRAGGVVVKESSGSWRLDRAAVKFYREEARYRPATRLGRLVRSTTTLIVRFELTEDDAPAKEPEPGPEPGP